MLIDVAAFLKPKCSVKNPPKTGPRISLNSTTIKINFKLIFFVYITNPNEQNELHTPETRLYVPISSEKPFLLKTDNKCYKLIKKIYNGITYIAKANKVSNVGINAIEYETPMKAIVTAV